MSDPVAVGCSLLLAWALFDLAQAVRRMKAAPYTVNLRQDKPHEVHHDGTVEYRVKHDEPPESWKGE